jgi:hypothetical protein
MIKSLNFIYIQDSELTIVAPMKGRNRWEGPTQKRFLLHPSIGYLLIRVLCPFLRRQYRGLLSGKWFVFFPNRGGTIMRHFKMRGFLIGALMLLVT